MMWDDLMVDIVVPMLQDDDELTTALGGQHIYMAQANQAVRIPSVEWLITEDVFSELFNAIEVQLDYWAKSLAQARAIERRIRALLHRETRRRLGDMDLLTQYSDSYTQEYPQPGIVHRSLRFRFEPVRRRYATA